MLRYTRLAGAEVGRWIAWPEPFQSCPLVRKQVEAR